MTLQEQRKCGHQWRNERTWMKRKGTFFQKPIYRWIEKWKMLSRHTGREDFPVISYGSHGFLSNFQNQLFCARHRKREDSKILITWEGCEKSLPVGVSCATGERKQPNLFMEFRVASHVWMKLIKVLHIRWNGQGLFLQCLEDRMAGNMSTIGRK